MSLIQGKPLLGFWGIFEQNFGDPDTESPMRIITPSFVGSSMLPFRCPRCQEVAHDLGCPLTREHYHDKRKGRDNHFCPSCGCRFKIDMVGVPLPCALEAGAIVGPSKVTYGEEITWQDMKKDKGPISTMLGFLFERGTQSGYKVLARGR